MANPFPFVAASILTAAELNGIGEAGTAFTPSWSSYTRGNGTSVAYYMRVNKLVYVYAEETLGTTASVTGGITMILPITAARTQAIQPSRSRIDDNGANVFWGTTVPLSSSSVALYLDLASGTYLAFSAISSTNPMTWTTNDKFAIGFVYEAA